MLSFIAHLAFDMNYIYTFVCGYVVFMEVISILENLKKAGINIGKFGKTLEEVKTTNEKDKKKIEKIVKIINDKEA